MVTLPLHLILQTDDIFMGENEIIMNIKLSKKNINLQVQHMSTSPYINSERSKA